MTTTWLSKSSLPDRATRAREGNSAVIVAALAVLAAIALYLVVSPSQPIAQDAPAGFAGP
jgi:hypothetical protein